MEPWTPTTTACSSPATNGAAAARAPARAARHRELVCGANHAMLGTLTDRLGLDPPVESPLAQAVLDRREGTMTGKLEVRMRRVYDDPSPADGTRVLVDRIWPRGLAKATARIDEWTKVVAPSTELRRWYGHDPGKFDQFRRRYEAELAEPERQAAVHHLRELARSGPLTLLTATRDIDHSQAAVLVRHLHGAR